MIRWMHDKLVRFPLTRRFERRLTRRVKGVLGSPDAYQDLIAICRKVKPAAFLEIGSHHGDTLVKMLDEVPGQTYHAFEPTPESVAVLRRRMAKYPNVTVHQLAVGAETGKVSFFLNAGNQTNSLLDNANGSDQPFAHWQKHVGRIESDVVRLDDWAPAHVPGDGALVIKADIQGAERLLVNGGRDTFRNRVKAIYTEVSLLPMYEGQTTFAELDTLLTRELGFVLFNIYPCGKDQLGRAAWTDALWVKQDILPV